ncbi:MAG TPA: excinuclease ABC subunit UvrC [Candidatus Sulfotelmatobacter sp.]|nr:excinuclease ABC subunit UvrC [Candidatus Sulfotelmatobacter sp.]
MTAGPETDSEPDLDADCDAAAEGAAAAGSGLIRAQLRTLPNRPGVYRMLDAGGKLLYVGKAKNLKKRVASYAKPTGLSLRIYRMVQETAALEIITTHTEVEALLLEANLIKRLKPRYNVVLRDDKSFPYIVITGDHAWPQIAKHRGARNRPGEYFGPFASAGAVNRTLAALQRAFPLRSCSDAEFAVRTRPCLQFQIKRCTAPCVRRIDAGHYAAIVAEARDFLSGRSQEIQRQLSAKMQDAAAAMDFETAAVFRDRIRSLAQIQAHQDINVESVGEADVIAAAAEASQTCVQVFFFRAGQNFGNRAYFPAHARDVEPGEVLTAFIGQFYDNRPAPKQILLSHEIEAPDLLGEALSVGAGRKVEVLCPQRGPKRALVEHALTNARDALSRRLGENASQRKLLEGVAEVFGLDGTPERIEVYDNSHIQGAQPIGSMIVAGPDGFMKGAYRKFNIRDKAIAPGDDYAMLREVLTRRFTRLLNVGEGEEDRVAGQWPDLVLIDGGKGQLSIAEAVFADLGVTEVALAAIAKGPDRNAGREHFFQPGREPFSLEPRHPVLYFLQRLRDEAHRYAIGTHRARRSKAIVRSALDEIPGVGAKRKQALLHHFGSARGVSEAGLADLESVSGISKAVAQTVYDHFHGG